MKINDYDYVAPKEVNGRILITSFPGLDENGIFQELNFQTQLNILQKNNCSSITSFVEDKEFLLSVFNQYIIEDDLLHHILEEESIFWMDDLPFVSNIICSQIKTTQ